LGVINLEVKGEENKSKLIYTDDDFKRILSFIKNIKFGSVTLVIQDGTIIQIETNEKIRVK
jgi:hypothetical protein